MNPFRQSIRKSIANEGLQAALDANTRRRLQGRQVAFASLPDWRERRRRAHAVRAEVISHLHEYLEQFSARARENGTTVHRARDAREAVSIVLDLARAHKARLIAKSKSMVSEEIELNHALEAQGLRVVETDLGEYIVQLRGEKPAHIITPAVHLRRQEVGRLFEEKLGIPYTEDIPTLTNTARRVLREVFLTSDIGLSGVNFGVAENGTLCIVTNEGNGRMVTTLPPVHIALMGMERLVPTLNDLALMLSLLPRSATGQKLSVYTQLLRGPLPGQERHLIIVDNGRSRLLDSPLQEALYCIRCGACLNACPVFRELGGHAYVGTDGSIAPYPGPIGSIISPGLLGLEQFGQLAQASSLCGACKDACPVDIDLPRMLTRVRAGDGRKDGIGLSLLSKAGLKAYGRIASSPALFSFAQQAARWTTRLLPDWFRLPAFTGWGYSKDFPKFARRSFSARWKDIEAKSETPGKIGEIPSVPAAAANPEPRSDSGIRRFTEELTALGGQVLLTDSAGVTQQIIDVLQGRRIDRIHLEPGAADESALRSAGISTVSVPEAEIRGGVTKAVCGLADTGSILVTNGPGEPLKASQLPELHIAILRASDILPSLPEALALPQVRGSQVAVFITGPSRTADIEMTLTIGVHGPRELTVCIVK